VVLDIADQAALEAAFAAMSKRFQGKEATYIVQQQRPPGCEVIVGATESPGLGSLVMFGLGGVFVEVMKDVAFGVAPLSRPEARALVRSIRGLPVLEGVRGAPGVDLQALEDLLCRVSRLAADHPEIVEMDLNPVFVHPAAVSPAVEAVDVRIRIR
jgi:acyl-CoA synthetase (NDP forming)